MPDRRKSPRLQVLDTGLLNHFAGLQNDLIGTKDLDAVYRGKIAEHIVGQEILASKYNILNELNFWVREKSNSNAEVDFVISHRGLIIPIEVKSGPSGTLRSLHSFMDAANHHFAIRLYNGILKIDKVKTVNDKEYNLLNLPYYLASRVENYIDWYMAQV